LLQQAEYKLIGHNGFGGLFVIAIEKDSLLGRWIAVVVIILMAIGTVFVFSASADIAKDFSLQRFYASPALRQLVYFPLGIAVLYLFSRLNYKRFSFEAGWYKSPTTYLFIISVILLVIVLLPQFGTEINRARRWLRVPLGPASISFQPSELAKWAMVFLLVGLCDKYNDTIKLFWKRFIPICLVVGLVVGLILIEDFGTAALVALLSFLILLIAGVNYWHILTPLPFAAVAFVLAIVTSPERMMRILAFLHPEQWAGSANYQASQSLIALGSGGLFGKGLGRGICKYGHLPEDTTDFIFAIICEELGFVGNAVVIALFIAFIVLGIFVVLRCKDRFGKLLAAGIVLTIGVQAALNIGVVTVVLPTKGLPLPFVSAGGTSMLLSAAAVGVLLNIAAQSTENSPEET
jgi:cell division protein FtsW